MLKKIQIGLLVCLFLAVMVTSCAKDDAKIVAFNQDLVVEIIAGPAEGGTVGNNANFAFTWRARGGGSSVTFTVQLSGVDASPVSTSETSRNYGGQPSGSYTFTVNASGGSESASATRTFTVAANAGAPSVTISGARGSSSSGGSGATPAYAPGQAAHFSWTGADLDDFGSVAGYRWRRSDADPFSEWTLGTTAGFDAPATPGSYTLTVEAQDNDGAVSTTTIGYEVKAAAILIVDDKPQGSAVDEVDEDGFFASMLQGYAFATWDVAAQGAPTGGDLAAYQVVIIYSEANSDLWDVIGNDYPESATSLSDFIDGGGRLWAMGPGILEDLRFPAGPGNDHANPPDPTEFEAAYLHIAAATGDTLVDPTLVWTRAGDLSGDNKFSFADDVLSDPVNYPRMTVDYNTAGSVDVDNIVAGTGAEIMYIGKGGLGDVLGNVGIRYPAGGSDTQVVFFTFPLFETASVKASLLNARALAQQIMSEMGQ